MDFTTQKCTSPPPPPKKKSALMSTLPDVIVQRNCKYRQNNLILNHMRKTLK